MRPRRAAPRGARAGGGSRRMLPIGWVQSATKAHKKEKGGNGRPAAPVRAALPQRHAAAAPAPIPAAVWPTRAPGWPARRAWARGSTLQAGRACCARTEVKVRVAGLAGHERRRRRLAGHEVVELAHRGCSRHATRRRRAKDECCQCGRGAPGTFDVFCHVTQRPSRTAAVPRARVQQRRRVCSRTARRWCAWRASAERSRPSRRLVHLMRCSCRGVCALSAVLRHLR
jgi:hypothetical protein